MRFRAVGIRDRDWSLQPKDAHLSLSVLTRAGKVPFPVVVKIAKRNSFSGAHTVGMQNSVLIPGFRDVTVGSHPQNVTIPGIARNQRLTFD